MSAEPGLNDLGATNAPPKASEAESALWQNHRREVKAISLDLWGTILDDNRSPADTVVYSAQRQNFLREVLQLLGQQFSPEQIRAAYKRAWHYFDALWEKQIAFGAKEGLQEMLRSLNAELPPESFQRVQRFFEEAIQPPQPLDHALETVQRLAQKYPLALISDTAWTPGRVLRQIFADYKILDCFRILIFSGEVGITKPHPQMFHLALNGLGVQARECLHVGDLQRTDVAGAKAVGMHAAWICRPVYAGAEQPDHGPSVAVKGVKEVAEKLLGA
jgi:putative hydrolase of the HAD superfamily